MRALTIVIMLTLFWTIVIAFALFIHQQGAGLGETIVDTLLLAASLIFGALCVIQDTLDDHASQ